MEMLHWFCLCSPRNKKREVKTLDEFEVIFLNEIDVEIFDKEFCHKFLEDILALQNEDKE